MFKKFYDIIKFFVFVSCLFFSVKAVILFHSGEKIDAIYYLVFAVFLCFPLNSNSKPKE